MTEPRLEFYAARARQARRAIWSAPTVGKQPDRYFGLPLGDGIAPPREFSEAEMEASEGEGEFNFVVVSRVRSSAPTLEPAWRAEGCGWYSHLAVEAGSLGAALYMMAKLVECEDDAYRVGRQRGQ